MSDVLVIAFESRHSCAQENVATFTDSLGFHSVTFYTVSSLKPTLRLDLPVLL